MLVTVEGDTLTELTLTLTRPGTISGIVVDADGRPVEGAAVQVESDALYTAGEGQARAQVFRTAKVSAGTLGVTAGPVPEIPRFGEPQDDAATVPMSDVNGRFVLEGLHPGSYALQAEHGLYARSAQTQIRIRSGEHRTGVRLVLGAGVHLTGRVVNDNFRPIIGASVELDDGSSVLTDVRGVFDAGFRRGRQNLVARAGGKVPREVTVTLRDTPVDLEIQLPDARGGLEGRALEPNGRPLPGVQVTLSMLDGLSPTRLAWTDARGVFELDALSSGRAEIELRHADFLPWTRTLTLEDEHTSLEATLLEGWSVEVFVAEPGTRDPIAGASVIGAEHHAVTDAKGMAILRGLSQSPVHIEVLAEGFTRGAVSVSRPASDVAEAEVELGLGGGMEGEVSDFRGDAIAGALVVVRDKRSRTLLAQVHTTAGGRWTVAGIPEGDVVVEAFPPVELEDEQAAIALDSDVIAGHVTKGVDLRFDRR
jgi:protocatechuate 3,4-dioxygenase beta subunit